MWPINDCAPFFFSFSDEIIGNAKKFPKLKNYFECALNFIFHCAETSTEKEIHIRESYLRASLMEFSILEDVINAECNLEKKFSYIKRPEPLFHLLKILRNTEIHLRIIELKKLNARFLWGGSDEKGKPNSINTTILVSQDLSIHNLNQWRDKGKYTDDQISTLLEWYNKEQKIFGTSNLVYHGLISLLNILNIEIFNGS